MPLADAGETTVLDALLTGRFLSLHVAAPPTGEVAGLNYIRQPVTFAKTAGPDPSVYRNSALIQFPAAGSEWGTVTHFGIWTDVSGGQLLAYNAVSTAKPIEADDVARWPIGALIVDTN